MLPDFLWYINRLTEIRTVVILYVKNGLILSVIDDISSCVL